MIIPASQAARVVQCPGSVRMVDAIPPRGGIEESAEGKLAHEVIERFMEDGTLPTNATEEMVSGARLWYATLQAEGVKKWHYERRLHFESINAANFGQPDAWGINELGELVVADYKFGHRLVQAVGNWQLLNYAVGIDADSSITHLIIVQPRAFGGDSFVRHWTVDRDRINYFKDIMINRYANAMSETPRLQVGPECMFCPARYVCPALQNAAMGSLDALEEAQPRESNVQEMAAELQALLDAQSVIDARRTGLEEELSTRARGGASIPGFHLLKRYTRRQWTIPLERVLSIGKMMGVDLSTRGVVTPTEAINMGISEQIISMNAQRKEKEAVLERDNTKISREIFS